MKVHIESVVFNQPENFRYLDKFLSMVEDGKHSIHLNENEEDSIMDSQWLALQHDGIKKLTQEIIAKIIVSLAYEEKNSKIHFVNSSNNDLNNLENSIKRLEDPLKVIMENSTSDGEFLRCLIRCFKKQSKRINKAMEKGWIEFVQAGGLTQIVSVAMIQYKNKNEPYAPRLFVLSDSNKVNPSDEKKEVSAIASFCQEKGIVYHTLYKREIENYLPFEVLEHHFENADAALEAFGKLTNDQKDFYNIDGGFSDKNEFPSGQEELFDGLSKENFQKLRKGFSKAKGDLYKLFSDTRINKENLLKRCEHQPDSLELKNLLNKVTAEL